MIRAWILAASAAALFAATPAYAQTDDVEAPLRTFDEAFNKGDIPAAMATHLPDAVIVDEFSPYRWSGTGSFAAWGASYMKDAAAKGITDPVVKIGAATRKEVEGNAAYVIVPATYTFKQKGVPMRAVAQMTFSLVKTDAGWKIASWTWTGPAPTAVK